MDTTSGTIADTNETLIIEDLRRVQLELKQSFGIPPSPLYPAPFNYAGMPVIEVPVTAVPKIRLSPDFEACSKEFRSGMNAWLLERFGTRDTTPIPKGQAFMVNESMLMIRRDNISAITACVGA